MENMAITEQERGCLPEEEHPLLRYHEFLKLRQPLEFHQVVGKNKVHTAKVYSNEVYSPVNDGPDYAPEVSALGNHVMRAGKHYATFKQVGPVLLLGGSMVSVGVIRPVDLSSKEDMEHFVPWDEEHYPAMAEENRTVRWGEDGKVDYAVYNTNGGNCFFGYWDNPNPTEEEETRREWPGKEHTPSTKEC